MTAVPSPSAATIPLSVTRTTDSSLELYSISNSSGTVVAFKSNLSPICKSRVLFSTLTLASIKDTLTVIVLFSAAAYLSLPAKETVTVAVPLPRAKIKPASSTRTILSSSEV